MEVKWERVSLPFSPEYNPKEFEAEEKKRVSFSLNLSSSLSCLDPASGRHVAKQGWPRLKATQALLRSPEPRARPTCPKPVSRSPGSPGDHVGCEAHEEGAYEGADLPGGALPPPLLLL